MNIVAHGLNLVDLAEVGAWISDPSSGFVARCFVQEELDEVGRGADRIERLAGLFAAKEAVLKALGNDSGDAVAFTEVVIQSAAAPQQLRLIGRAKKMAARRGITEWRLSISHAGAMAAASAIAINGTSHTLPEWK